MPLDLDFSEISRKIKLRLYHKLRVKLSLVSQIPNSRRLHITSHVGEEKNFAYNWPEDTSNHIDPEAWTHIQVEQTYESGKYFYSVKINGEVKKYSENSQPMSVDNLNVWSCASGRCPSQNALIRNLKYKTYARKFLFKIMK